MIRCGAEKMNEEQHCRGPGVSFQRHALYFSLINSNKALTLSEKYSKIRSENEKGLEIKCKVDQIEIGDRDFLVIPR